MNDLNFLINSANFGKYSNWKTFLEIIFRITKICNQNCVFYKNCVGILKSYISVFGNKEFEPIIIDLK